LKEYVLTVLLVLLAWCFLNWIVDGAKHAEKRLQQYKEIIKNGGTI
jgi:hypothetical protein